MYDELVTRLWECASGECFNCSQYTPTTNASICQKELMKQAANAIEELSAVNERQLLEIAVLSKPRWIPVTERLPKYGKHVLVYAGFFQPYIEGAYYCEDRKWRFTYDDAEVVGVSHWMPLPTPPTAEEGNVDVE